MAGEPPAAHTPLTPKQLHFTRCVAQGMTQAAAYREAYDVGEGTRPETHQAAASRLMQKAAIRARVERLIEEKERALSRSAVSDRERVLSKLRQWIEPELDAEGAPRLASASELKAAELLGRAVGLYRDVVEDSRSRSSDEVQAEIERKLLGLLGNDEPEPLVIEHKATGTASDSELDADVGTPDVAGEQMH